MMIVTARMFAVPEDQLGANVVRDAVATGMAAALNSAVPGHPFAWDLHVEFTEGETFTGAPKAVGANPNTGTPVVLV